VALTSYSLRVGTFEQRVAFTPGKQIWPRSAPPRVDALASAPATKKNEGRDGAPSGAIFP
jgi:hypothetical protein